MDKYWFITGHLAENVKNQGKTKIVMVSQGNVVAAAGGAADWKSSICCVLSNIEELTSQQCRGSTRFLARFELSKAHFDLVAA